MTQRMQAALPSMLKGASRALGFLREGVLNGVFKGFFKGVFKGFFKGFFKRS